MVRPGRGRKVVVVLGRMGEYVDPLQQSQVMVRPGRGRKVEVLGRMGE
jgi:hypothetical protein